MLGLVYRNFYNFSSNYGYFLAKNCVVYCKYRGQFCAAHPP